MTFDEFLPFVLPSVPGCPDSLALSYVLRAARDFCARTHVWNFTSTEIPSVVDQAEYDLDLDETHELVRVLWCQVDGSDYLVPNASMGRRMSRQNVGNLCSLIGPRTISLKPVPAFADRPILVDVAIKPSMLATAWPDDLTEYVQDIAYGAIGHLMLMPKQDWSDAGSAAVQLALFGDRLATVGLQVSKGFGRSRRHAAIVWG